MRRRRCAKIPTLPVPEDFPQFLDIRETHPLISPRRLHGPDQNPGLLPVPAIDANHVAVHGSPLRVADDPSVNGVADRQDAEAPARSSLWLQQWRGAAYGLPTDSDEKW